MNKRTSKRLILGLCVIALFAYSVIDQVWPKVFPKTEVVVINATEQELRDVVVDMPGESVSFGTVPAGDYSVRKITRRVPEPGFVPSQRGTLADGTHIVSHGLSGGEGVAFARAVYTVRCDGTQWARIRSVPR